MLKKKLYRVELTDCYWYYVVTEGSHSKAAKLAMARHRAMKRFECQVVAVKRLGVEDLDLGIFYQKGQR